LVLTLLALLALLPSNERIRVCMGDAVSYRLSLDEIIYLSIAEANGKKQAPVQNLYGLRNKPLPKGQPDGPEGQADEPKGQADEPKGQPDEPKGQPDEPEGQADGPEGTDGQKGQPKGQWANVRQGLLDKQMLWYRGKDLALCSDILGRIIQAISRPKVLVVIRPGGEGQMRTRLYIRGLFAVTAEDERYEEDYYLLRYHDSRQEVEEVLRETVGFARTDYKPGTASIPFDTATLKKLMGAVREGARDEANLIFRGHGLDDETAADLYEALQEGNHLLSYAVVAFDPAYREGAEGAGSRQAHEVLLYGGPVHMWQVRIEPSYNKDDMGGHATISVTTPEEVLNGNLRVISELMSFV